MVVGFTVQTLDIGHQIYGYLWIYSLSVPTKVVFGIITLWVLYILKPFIKDSWRLSTNKKYIPKNFHFGHINSPHDICNVPLINNFIDVLHGRVRRRVQQHRIQAEIRGISYKIFTARSLSD